MDPAQVVESPPVVATVPPHARALLERARKLEALPLDELARRAAAGLARLRAGLGLAPRDADPLRALLAALPATALARGRDALERELAAARDAARASAHTAAEVERRSESLKTALRDRSADLAAALGRAEEAAALAAERETLRGEVGALRDALTERSNALTERSDALTELRERVGVADSGRARVDAELASARGENARLTRALTELAGERDALAARIADEATATVARERAGADDARRDVDALRERIAMLRSVLVAADARTESARHVAELDATARVDALAAAASAQDELRGALHDAHAERDAARAELALAHGRCDDARRALDASYGELDATRHALGATRVDLGAAARDLDAARAELAWRRREMDALRADLGGMRWRFLGGDAAGRVSGWDRRADAERRP